MALVGADSRKNAENRGLATVARKCFFGVDDRKCRAQLKNIITRTLGQCVGSKIDEA